MVTKEALELEMREAMRSGDELKKNTLRLLLLAIKLAEVELRSALDEPGLLRLIQKEAKARQETLADAQQAGREDLAARATAELELLQGYLPVALSQAELEELARAAIGEVGASQPGDLGAVMKVLMPRVGARADGKQVSALVRKLLGAG